ncbi:hypothetical protein [Paracoccus wurundjeri]|uniref:hypothetical protein n=1 Tax=Paracoccus onubensis TaxID=1675788 RepID=UPI002730A6BB|nr:hypothetical protein [Paracoccus onubensis]
MNPRTGLIKEAKLEELLGERGKKDRWAVRHGEVQDVVTSAIYIANKNAYAEAKRAAENAKSIYGSGTTPIADILVEVTHTQSAPLVLLTDSVAGFETGGFVATLSGYIDTTHQTTDVDVFANVILAIDGVDVAKQRIGIRTAASEIVTAMLPFYVVGTFDTPDETPAIEARAYSTLYDDETAASDSFYIREARLVISGSS